MNVALTFRPLDHATWPNDGRRHYRACPFRAGYAQTILDLKYELHRIGVKSAVIEIDIADREIRQDGLPRSDARAKSPRVRLGFTHPVVGPLQYPCDTFHSWQDNLRAVVKTLEAQRAMDRYGATRRNQQYAGWKQLPGAVELGAVRADAPMPLDDAVRTIMTHAGEALGQPDIKQRVARTFSYYRELYRRAVKRTHPDAGGRQEDFARVIRAKRTLDLHHGDEA